MTVAGPGAAFRLIIPSTLNVKSVKNVLKNGGAEGELKVNGETLGEGGRKLHDGMAKKLFPSKVTSS